MKDNQELRALLCLPPVKPEASNAITFPTIPAQDVVTGNAEIDAVLWLQKVIATGNPYLIEKAMEASGRIETPMEDLQRQYAAHLAKVSGSTFYGAFESLRFGELENLARRAIRRGALEREAISRFGDKDSAFSQTAAESACRKALQGLSRSGQWKATYDQISCAARFDRVPSLRPHTLDDCLHSRQYWDRLYRLRDAWQYAGDHWPEVEAHEEYCLAKMARIPARSLHEAGRVFDYLKDEDLLDAQESRSILRNLILSGWRHSQSEVTA